ncbi:MAG: hypothetical protein Q4G49_03035 [Paracoccus sp. (in: a-proteobacteria)]|nr:hypothetical protein [Paracoccus sp. (in: a-proteobacteria)]
MVASITPAEQSHLISRQGRRAAALIWIAARHIRTGGIETAGFWTGSDHRDFMIDGVSRLYFGAGGLISLDPIRSVTGLDVQKTTASFALQTPEVEQAVRGYDLRQAEVEIHRALFDPVTLDLIGISRKFAGWVDVVDITEAATDAPGSCKLTMVGSARRGTRPLSLKRGDASQRLRKLPDGRPDRLMQYADISGAVPAKWGVS